jgi:segregation and condensation protein A
MTSFVLDLDNFQGPFDLLLKLLDQEKLEITDISLAKITDDFLDYIAQMNLDIHEMNSFLYVAAKLSLDKSRAVVNIKPSEDDTDIDLALTLRQYQVIKKRAKILYTHSRTPMRARDIKLDLFPAKIRINALKFVSLYMDTKKASQQKPNTHRIMSKKGYVHLTKDKFNWHVAKLKSFSIDEIMSKPNNKSDAIIFFLTILEMIKSEGIFEKDGIFVAASR